MIIKKITSAGTFSGFLRTAGLDENFDDSNMNLKQSDQLSFLRVFQKRQLQHVKNLKIIKFRSELIYS